MCECVDSNLGKGKGKGGGGDKAGKKKGDKEENGKYGKGKNEKKFEDTEITEASKIKICELYPDDMYNLVVCAIQKLSKEHKVSMEEILKFIKEDYELPMTDCEFYVQMEQQLIKAVACGAVCVRMGKFYAAGMKPPSNFDLKTPHCHEKPFPPPECPSEDEEEEEDEESDGGGKGGGGGGGGRTEKGGKGAEKKAGGGGKITNEGGKGGGGGGGGGGKGKGGGGGGGKRGGGHGTAAGYKDGDGKERKDKRDGGNGRGGGNGRDGGNGHGKCKCDVMRSKEKCRKSESGCKSGSKTSDICGNESDVEDSTGSGGRCEDEELHLDRLALRRPSFKPVRRSRMPELHPIYRSKMIRCLQETPPCLYNYRGPRKPNGLGPRYP